MSFLAAEDAFSTLHEASSSKMSSGAPSFRSIASRMSSPRKAYSPLRGAMTPTSPEAQLARKSSVASRNQILMEKKDPKVKNKTSRRFLEHFDNYFNLHIIISIMKEGFLLGNIGRATQQALQRTDLQILSALLQNCRTSDSAIARSIRRSKDTVRRRREDLERNGIISGYQAYIDGTMLGHVMTLAFLDLDLSLAEQESYCRRVAPQVIGATRISGKWNCVVAFYHATHHERNKVLSSLFAGERVRKHHLCEAKSIHFTTLDYTRQNIVVHDRNAFESAFLTKNPPIEISSQDREILRILHSDARANITHISKQTHLSRQTTKQRISRLISAGIIRKFQAHCNPFDIGNYPFILTIELKDPGVAPTLIAFLCEKNICNDIIETTGEYSLVAVPHFISLEEMLKFEEDLIGRFQSALHRWDFHQAAYQPRLDWLPPEIASIPFRNTPSPSS